MKGILPKEVGLKVVIDTTISEITKAAAYAVWNRMKSANIMDSVRIGRMAKSIEDVNFIVDTFSRS